MCESESSEDETNFKRSKRFKHSPPHATGRDEIDARVTKSRAFTPKPVSVSSPRPSNGIKSNSTSSKIDNSSSTKAVTEVGRNGSDIYSSSFLENGDGEVDDKRKRATLNFRSSATEIMKIMGFERGKGLGQLMTDREVSAAELDKIHEVLKEAGIDIDKSIDFKEELPVEEEVQWIKPELPVHSLDFPSLSGWRKIGLRRSGISGETSFVDAEVLRNLLVLKKCFNVLTEHDYQQIRARSNPFEAVGKGPFICRAGMKMANLDAILSFGLTQPNSPARNVLIGPNELFYFADVCAGPGGFSEYVLLRKNWCGKGFGMTLKGKLDFDIWSFAHGSPESFEPFYGHAGDGNVYNPSNTTSFINYVLSSTEGRGVHLLMADGGFDIENKEMQEILSSQIYISQCLLALALIRPDGMFVCKLFDTLTPFTIGLIYLMYCSFELVAIHKPNSSRPANSERYLVCKWKKPDTDGIASYLNSCHALLWSWTEQQSILDWKEDIIELVPLKILKENTEFYNYIVQSNNAIARKQIKSLKKMVLFSQDPNLEDPRKESIRRKCFDYWKIPESCKKNSLPPMGADKFFKNLLGTTHSGAMGRDRIYRLDGKNWTFLREKLELCKNTLVFGEFVDEIHGKKPSQKIVRTFHIVDALVLGGKDVRALHYTQRHEVCVKFAQSMNKPSRPELCAVRAKNPVRTENMADIFDRLENRQVTGSGNGMGAQLVCPVDHTDETLPFIKPAGILFLKITKDPWTMALSRSANRKYYFNLSTGASDYHVPEESISGFDYTMQHRMVWWWDKETKTILATQDVTDESRTVNTSPGVLNPQWLLQFIAGAWQANRSGLRFLKMFCEYPKVLDNIRNDV
ncbi:Cap-specific mRNA (nucleoside-2'-O-)-methyltransferase 1 [Orchesella cincta]|uniref:Cap-specific mRNA (nucleoside-2'-O-)-methyltransferase 1 n=1 Tax=Orchesella cincta TaxID=48709 RepID=A0A1D2N828_ORCCI|nr:Cap-specific mRNA (nucleoside-2'-O-)-methyltransferase 1 [Orchesella cincta]